MAQERRVYPRVKDDLGISFRVVPEPGAIPQLRSPAFHLTEDISEGGLRFRHDQGFRPGTMLKVYAALKSPLMTVTRFARVCWTRAVEGASQFDVGIEFTESTPPDRDAWVSYVRQFPQAGHG